MWVPGCVLYTLLRSLPQFYDESINVLMEKVACGHYTFLSPGGTTSTHPVRAPPNYIVPFSDSFAAKNLITHLLCFDPTQRYLIAEFLRCEWYLAALAERGPDIPETLLSICWCPEGSRLIGPTRCHLSRPQTSPAHRAFGIYGSRHGWRGKVSVQLLTERGMWGGGKFARVDLILITSAKCQTSGLRPGSRMSECVIYATKKSLILCMSIYVITPYFASNKLFLK